MYYCILGGVVSTLYLSELGFYLVQKTTATSRRPVPIATEDSSESSEEDGGGIINSVVSGVPTMY
jgi:hypothetical protein